MDMFEKATKTVKSVGENVISSAKTVGSTLYSATKEQSELASLTVQKSVIEKNLNSSYAEIGKRYVAYISECRGDDTFDVSDIIEKIQPDLEKMEEIDKLIEEKQLEIKQGNEERMLKKAQNAFEMEKGKLDKALQMEIITDLEYQIKLAAAQKKLDHYDLLRKVELQWEMGILTKEEYTEKIKTILG